jgi:hypothetical protein
MWAALPSPFLRQLRLYLCARKERLFLLAGVCRNWREAALSWPEVHKIVVSYLDFIGGDQFFISYRKLPIFTAGFKHRFTQLKFLLFYGGEFVKSQSIDKGSLSLRDLENVLDTLDDAVEVKLQFNDCLICR